MAPVGRAGELLWCGLLARSPRAGLVAHSSEMGTCQGEGGAFSAAQANPNATRPAWSWDRAFSSPVVGCGQLVMTNPG